MHIRNKSAKVGRYLDLEAFNASFMKGIGILTIFGFGSQVVNTHFSLSASTIAYFKDCMIKSKQENSVFELVHTLAKE